MWHAEAFRLHVMHFARNRYSSAAAALLHSFFNAFALGGAPAQYIYSTSPSPVSIRSTLTNAHVHDNLSQRTPDCMSNMYVHTHYLVSNIYSRSLLQISPFWKHYSHTISCLFRNLVGGSLGTPHEL